MMAATKDDDVEKDCADEAQMLKTYLDEQETPMWLDGKRAMAQERFGDFRAYMAAGFSEEQALYLCQQDE